MKRICFTFTLLVFSLTLSAQTAKKKPAIKWYTWTGAIEAMEKDDQPKKIMVDLYTEWCGYCKKMDRETFTDPVVINYVNEHFYPVKFDAEQKGSLRYANHNFTYDKTKGRRGVHLLAFALTDGAMSYPTMVYLDETQKRIAISPGFKPGDSFMTELRFVGDNHYKVTDYETYKKKEGER